MTTKLSPLRAENEALRHENAALRNALMALADRVQWWSLDIAQDKDIHILQLAREFGWLPWHEREPGHQEYLRALGHTDPRGGRELPPQPATGAAGGEAVGS